MAERGAATRERILQEAERLVLAGGYAGTSLDEVVDATEMTKGAFFYHFKSKADLARALIERFWEKDKLLLHDLVKRARELGDEPLQVALIFLKLFEEHLAKHEDAPVSCLLASYIYESGQFDDDILAYIRVGFREWAEIYIDLFAPIFAEREPRVKVTAEDLAEMATCLIEGAFVLSRAKGDSQVGVRASRQFRHYLQLIFAG